jgi:hypothetical protein
MNVLTPVKICSAVSMTPAKHLLIFITVFSVIAGVVDTGEQFIAGDNATGDNFIAEKIEGDKSVISSAAEVGHGRRWCHWNRYEKLHP